MDAMDNFLKSLAKTDDQTAARIKRQSMAVWECVDCKQEAVTNAAGPPPAPFRWSDGHVCTSFTCVAVGNSI